MEKILIVEDEQAMRLGLSDNLEFEGYEVDSAEDGEIGLKKIMHNSYSLILLDVMLPKMSGFDICKKVRSEGNKTPIILLTARGEEIDKVLGLEMGADDYITKPFSVRELLARVKAVMRRYQDNAPVVENVDIAIGRLNVNFKTYTATEQGKQISLSIKEFDVLKYLYDKQNQTVSRDDLLTDIWGQNIYTTTRTIDNFILKLRQKIEHNPNEPKIILTVHGIGYKMIR